MKLCLVTLPTIIQNRSVRHYQTPPLGVCYVASSARAAGHEVVVVDALGEALDQYTAWRPDHELNGLSFEQIVARVPRDAEVIGVSAMFSNHWPVARDILVALRGAFPDAILLAGGEHITAAPQYSLDNSPVDYLVLGEGEETVVELLEALAKPELPDLTGIPGIAFRDAFGQYVKTRPRTRLKDIDSLPWPAWDLVPIERYIDLNEFVEPSSRRVITMLATRGCPFECKFCSNPQMWTRRFYMRDARDVVDEMERYERDYGVTEFQFFDLTFVINKEWVLEFCNEVRSRGHDYVWKLPSGTRSEVIDAELLSAISESGCRAFTLAPETGSKRIAKLIKKPLDLDRFVEIGRIVRRNDIDMQLNFYMIIGTPDERLADLLQSFYFMMRMAVAGFDTMGINKFMTYPGSEYHNEFVAQGSIEYSDEYFLGLRLDNRYDSYNTGLGFEPPWSPRQLKWIITSGYLLFYATYYLSHPPQMFHSVRAVLRDEPKNRIEAIFANMVRRMRRLLPSSAA